MTKHNIRKLLAQIKKLEFLAYYDELTKVYNRRGFFENSEKIFKAVVYRKKELERRIGYRIPLSIIFLDIDNFKKINDTYGHKIGDKVLERVAKVIKERLRDSDIIGRLGGEEFVIALIGCDLNSAQKIAEDLRQRIEKLTIKTFRGKLKITASLGVVSYKDEKSLQELIARADQAMYRAKKGGKNRVVVL
ncbi:MAG: GGDEF domain-containing protein [Patescibacteria group bacterium]|nr:GGDEF domain-containing protein [Patescibacteria group bacterium]